MLPEKVYDGEETVMMDVKRERDRLKKRRKIDGKR
jgi:hypothetical protein